MFIVIILIVIAIVIYKKRESEAEDDFLDVISNPELDGRIKFLLKQFSQKKLTIKEEYMLPRELKKVSPESMEKVLDSILDHMKLKKNVFLVYHTKNEKAFKGKGGTYEQAPLGYKAINLVLVPEYRMADYVSVLAHECAHHYMDVYNFEIKERLENEKNTDTLAVLLGFGRYLEETHRERTHYKGSSYTFNGTVNHYETSKLGYLSAEEVHYISYKHREILKKGRKQKEQLKAKQERENKEANLTENLSHRVDLLKRGCEENSISIQRVMTLKGSEKINSKWDLERLSQLIHRYQNNTYAPRIEALSQRVKKRDEHNQIIKEINELDEQLRMDSFFIAKYLN